MTRAEVEATEQKMARCTATGHAAATALASQKAKESAATTAFDSAALSKSILELQTVIAQCKLDLLEEMKRFSVDNKLFALFDCLDRDGNGKIPLTDIREGLRRINGHASFIKKVDMASEKLPILDANDDGAMTTTEFQNFLNVLLPATDSSLEEFVDLMTVHGLFNDSNYANEPHDERMIMLFLLFDTNGANEVEFKKVAVGLSEMTGDMDEGTKTAWGALLVYADENERSMTYPEFARLLMNVAAAANMDFDFVADALTVSVCCPKDKDIELASIFQEDHLSRAVQDSEYAFDGHTDGIDAFQYGRLQRLFDLWDLNHDGNLDVSELVLGLRKFQDAKNLAITVDESISAMLAFDSDKNGQLDRGEFAHFLAKFAKTAHTALDELIDFMVVQSALRDNDEAEKAYVKALGEKAQAKLVRRGGGSSDSSKKWFSMG